MIFYYPTSKYFFTIYFLRDELNYFQKSLIDIIHLRRVPAHPVLCVLHVAEPLLVVVDHVVVGHPARGPQLDDVEDLDPGDKLQLLIPGGCPEHRLRTEVTITFGNDRSEFNSVYI